MFWMHAYPLPGIPEFFGPQMELAYRLVPISQGPKNWTRLSARSHFTGPKKLGNSRAQPPPTSPRNGYARIYNIMHGAV